MKQASPGQDEHRRRNAAFWIAACGALIGIFAAARFVPSSPSQTAIVATSTFLPAQGRLFLYSVSLAATATALAVALAFPVGVHLGRRGSVLCAVMVLVPLMMPGQISASLWRFALTDVVRLVTGDARAVASSGFSFFAAAWTLAAVMYPVIALPVAMALRMRGNRLERELANVAPPRAVFIRATLPGLAPGLLGGAGVFFLLALANSAAPLMWNVPSQSRAMFARLAAYFDPGEVLLMSVPMQAVALVLCAAAVVWILRRPWSPDAEGAGVVRACKGEEGRAFAPVAGLVLLATIGAPLVSLILSISPRELAGATLSAGASPLAWGLIIAALGATGAASAGVAFHLVARRMPKALGAVLEVAGLVALFVPSALLCVLFSMMLRMSDGIAAFYNSLAMFALAYGVRFFYIPWKVLQLSRTFECKGHENVERIAGVPFVSKMRLRAAGMFSPALALSWLLVFAFAFGELEIASFLAQPGRQPLSVFLDNLLHYGRSATLAIWYGITVAAEIALACLVLTVGLVQWRKLRVEA